MSRLQFLLVSVLVGAAACSGSTDEPTTTIGDDAVTTAATSADTSTDSETTTTATPGSTTTLSDRPLAPDFTLELADGGEYTLSEGAKPVYLVFWAEW